MFIVIHYNYFDLTSVISKLQQPIIHMARGLRNSTKMEQISIRLPVDLIDDLNKLKEKEQIDRSVIIVKAIRYWLSVDGNVSTDNEFLNQIREMKSELNEVKSLMGETISHYEKESAEMRTLLTEQQKTINTLLRMMPKEE